MALKGAFVNDINPTGYVTPVKLGRGGSIFYKSFEMASLVLQSLCIHYVGSATWKKDKCNRSDGSTAK